MLSGKLQDSLSEGVSKASRLMSNSRSSSADGEMAEASNSSDFMLRSIEVLSSVKLSAGATSRFFLTVLPVRARVVGGTSGKKEWSNGKYYTLLFKTLRPVSKTVQKFGVSQ